MKFTKMQGIGNDYIYLFEETGADLPHLAKTLSKRHFSIGSDGLIHLSRGEDGDFVMEMYNGDGSQGAMCGNGIRCVGKFLYEGGYTTETCLRIQTAAGPREILLEVDAENLVQQVTVNMGVPTGFLEQKVRVDGRDFVGTFVSMGNPHFVLLCEDPKKLDIPRLGGEIQSFFSPDGVNVEFYCPTEDGFSMEVWERGSGVTLACGTGACATYAVGQKLGVLDEGALVAQLAGGDLSLWREGANIMMKGPAVTVYQGEVFL